MFMTGCSPGENGGGRFGRPRSRRRRHRPPCLFVLACAATAPQLAAGEKNSLEFTPRNFTGEGNNIEFPLWGAAGTTLIRSLVDADYADDGFTAPGEDRPTAREVMTDVFLTSTAGLSGKSSLFVAWGQLVSFDLSLTLDNDTDPLNVPCNGADDQGGTDIWCPFGDASDDIPFFRSDASIDTDGVRSPINYATSFLDLDFVYGRTTDEALTLRTEENGLMNITASGVPHQNSDGTWMIPDQRTAKYPVTFALHIMLLLEHNRCCVDEAPLQGFEGDEDIYQACRVWTIATYQHVTQNDFLIRLLGLNIEDLGLDPFMGSSMEDFTESHDMETFGQNRFRRRSLYHDYNLTVNPSADVFAVTIGGAAFESALPGTVRIVSHGYVSVDDDNIGLNAASADVAGLFARNDIGNVFRGAVLSPALDIDPYHTPVVSNLSPLFKLPVDAVQRGRDHGLPTYNDAREAYGLSAVSDFSEVTPDPDLADRLSLSYGGDIDNLDAYTGALAEGTHAISGGVLGDLLFSAWSDQLFRVIAGDRLYHTHARTMENVANTTLRDVISRVTDVTDLPLSVFQAPTITVCDGGCDSEDGTAYLSDSFEISWEELEDNQISFTLRCKDIGNAGWLGIGWGGLTMELAEDYVICLVLDETSGECTDHAYTTAREVPPLDDAGETNLNVTEVSVEAGWTSITFVRDRVGLDGQDYDLAADIDEGANTLVVYAFREGSDIGQHPNANRGAATINFATGEVDVECDDNDFLLVHGALMLVAWMVLAPLGIYFVRYRKGESIRVCTFDFEWFEMHQELMIIASEAVLPLAITAVFASGGDHTTEHAHWGFYLIAAVALQVLSGFVRVKGLEAAQANFSLFHRFNKHFHIWSGRVAYVAGVVQCYRGLELVSGDDNLVLSAADGLDLELANFDTIQDVAFPIWFWSVAVLFVLLESRKQYRRYFKKGSAKICGFVEVVNVKYQPDEEDENDGIDMERLVPRTEELPLYTMAEFNEKVLHGQSWVLVDGAILDVSEFSHRHPGGARLILNALGTDVTHELLGEDLSVGHAMSFSPHKHPESAWEIVRSLVVGYIDEDEDEEEEETVEGGGDADKKDGGLGRGKEKGGGGGGGGERAPPLAKASSVKDKNRAFRIAGKAVMMQGRAAHAGGVFDPARKANDLAVLPDPASVPAPGGAATTFGAQGLTAVTSPTPAIGQFKRSWSSKKLLVRYHVCPLLFREKMEPAAAAALGERPTKRPVYRYVFSCPGQAQALVEAIKGVCHFNMRAQAPGKGVIQRSYNAYAVRVQDADEDGGDGKKAGVPKVIPANETTKGTLCIEMRIRIYHDGAMSQLLEKLAKDPDNPAVQLQGPYIVNSLVPPPAHRNVIMIAAGTGVNPMVQQIRDYLALPREASKSMKSRLSLIWQSVCEAELYGTEEITALQAKSQGLLEVTVLISGDQRRRNIPGAAFKKRIMAKGRAIISPMLSSSSSFSDLTDGRRSPSPRRGHERSPAHGASAGARSGENTSSSKKQGKSALGAWEDVMPSKFGPHPKHVGRTRELETPTRKPRGTPAGHDRTVLSDLGAGGLLRGKVTKNILEKAFGPVLLNDIADWNGKLSPSGGGSRGEEKGGEEEEDSSAKDLLALTGTDTVAGKLQVVISGPSGFVFYVENILMEMGVPRDSIVLLD